MSTYSAVVIADMISALWQTESALITARLTDITSDMLNATLGGADIGQRTNGKRKDQMMSEDLIKRSDVVEVVYKALKTPPLKGVLTDTMSLAIALVQDMPSADRPQEWIPCSERLPSEGEYVLVTEKWHGHVWMWRLQHIDDEPTWDVDGYNVDIDEAIAWMPLPEPYREEEK